jgi:hypothetical protein
MDHSRYSLGLEACADQQEETVRDRLIGIFRRYGMPFQMLMDNGSPWGSAGEQLLTAFEVWLIQLGIRVTHGRPYHPQTQGKDERFHRTLKAEVLNGRSFRDTEDCQTAFDRWRLVYNHERPHEALELEPPASRYKISSQEFPEKLPAIEYGPSDTVRKVDEQGCISFKGRRLRVSRALRHQPIALRPTDVDGVLSVHFCAHQVGLIDLRAEEKVCGFVDIAGAMPTTPQTQQQQLSI